jgi:hypothetical protein
MLLIQTSIRNRILSNRDGASSSRIVRYSVLRTPSLSRQYPGCCWTGINIQLISISGYLSLETAAVHNEAKVLAAPLDINGPCNIWSEIPLIRSFRAFPLYQLPYRQCRASNSGQGPSKKIWVKVSGNQPDPWIKYTDRGFEGVTAFSIHLREKDWFVRRPQDWDMFGTWH